MEFVNFVDIPTNKVTRIPASELTNGMIMFVREGRENEGVFWADAKYFKRNYVPKHPPFEGETKEQIEEIQMLLAEVHPLSYEEWEEGFRCDAHPLIEIKYWLRMGLNYYNVTKYRNYNLEQKKEIFSLCISIFQGWGQAKYILPELHYLSRQEAKRILEKLSEGYEPQHKDN